jgi:hypothetical protein
LVLGLEVAEREVAREGVDMKRGRKNRGRVVAGDDINTKNENATSDTDFGM